MPKSPYNYEVNGKLVTRNGSLLPICSLSNNSLMPSLTVLFFLFKDIFCACRDECCEEEDGEDVNDDV